MPGTSDKLWEDGGGFVSFFVALWYLLFPEKGVLKKPKLIRVEMCLMRSIYHWFGWVHLGTCTTKLKLSESSICLYFTWKIYMKWKFGLEGER